MQATIEVSWLYHVVCALRFAGQAQTTLYCWMARDGVAEALAATGRALAQRRCSEVRGPAQSWALGWGWGRGLLWAGPCWAELGCGTVVQHGLDEKAGADKWSLAGRQAGQSKGGRQAAHTWQPMKLGAVPERGGACAACQAAGHAWHGRHLPVARPFTQPAPPLFLRRKASHHQREPPS